MWLGSERCLGGVSYILKQLKRQREGKNCDVNNTISEQCDGSTRQVDNKRYERKTCKLLCATEKDMQAHCAK